MSSILIASNLELNWLSKILEVKNIQLYFAFLFVFLGFNFKHLRGTNISQNKKVGKLQNNIFNKNFNNIYNLLKYDKFYAIF